MRAQQGEEPAKASEIDRKIYDFESSLTSINSEFQFDNISYGKSYVGGLDYKTTRDCVSVILPKWVRYITQIEARQ